MSKLYFLPKFNATEITCHLKKITEQFLDENIVEAVICRWKIQLQAAIIGFQAPSANIASSSQFLSSYIEQKEHCNIKQY